MIDLNLTGAQEDALNRALADSHPIRIRVYRCDLDGNVRNPLDHLLMGGQVTVDAKAAVTRSASVDLFDPNRTMGFVPDSPAEADIFLDDMLRIYYDVWVEELSEWIEIPIFVGPVSSVTRNNDIVTVECQGKETLAMNAIWVKGKTFKKGRRRVEVIKEMLRTYAGEDQFVMPELKNAKLKKDTAVTKKTVPWPFCKKIAKGLEGRQLFYDGRGRVRLRVPPEKPVYIFRDATAATDRTPGPTVMSVPQVTYSSENLVNAVRVTGGIPRNAPDKDKDKTDDEKKNDKDNEAEPKKITAEVTAHRDHPLSPFNLGAGSTERYFGKEINNNSLRTKTEAMELALKTLRLALLRNTEVQFDALPIPYLEEEDMVRIASEHYDDSFVLNSFTIPLTAGDLMAVNYTWRQRKRRYQRQRERRLHRINTRAARRRERRQDRQAAKEFKDYRQRVMSNDNLTDKQKQRKLREYKQEHNID